MKASADPKEGCAARRDLDEIQTKLEKLHAKRKGPSRQHDVLPFAAREDSRELAREVARILDEERKFVQNIVSDQKVHRLLCAEGTVEAWKTRGRFDLFGDPSCHQPASLWPLWSFLVFRVQIVQDLSDLHYPELRCSFGWSNAPFQSSPAILQAQLKLDTPSVPVLHIAASWLPRGSGIHSCSQFFGTLPLPLGGDPCLLDRRFFFLARTGCPLLL